MRYLASALSVWMLVGCHNQTSSFSNPFMPPDRVPPPSTQPLTPGTAQPYYPGGPVQPAPPVAGQPTVPPAPPASGGQAPPLMPTTPTVPPSGWNRSPQPVPGSAARAPVYGGQPTNAYAPSPTVTNPAVVSSTAVSNPPPQVPGQTILPAQYQAPAPYANMAATPGSPAGTVVQGTEPQRPVVRELTVSELQPNPGAGTLH